MPGRSYTSQSYRYGFQGQEKDDEVKGAGNSINYKYRMHDPRLGRFLSLDPLASEYPMWSPYVFSGNQVIHTIELEGAEPLDALGIGSQKGLITSSTEEEYDQDPFRAGVKDASYILLNLMLIDVADDIIDDYLNPDVSATEATLNAAHTIVSPSKGKGARGVKGKPASQPQITIKTSKAARRDAMRQQNIPTSQPLIQDKLTKSNDKVFLTRDKKYTVQDAKNDVSHKNQPHWEAGPTKTDINKPDGLNRSGKNSKPQMGKPKSKSNYTEGTN